MNIREHWTLRLFALLVIGLCMVRCGGTKETVIVVAPTPNYTPSSYSHRLTADEVEEQKHPRPISPPDMVGFGFYQEYQWWVK